MQPYPLMSTLIEDQSAPNVVSWVLSCSTSTQTTSPMLWKTLSDILQTTPNYHTVLNPTDRQSATASLSPDLEMIRS